MNYFGHAALAILRRERPFFVLGAMLPDFLAMLGGRLQNKRGGGFIREQLANGVDFHLKTDAVFHQAPVFVAMNRRALIELRQLGVSRGPARACAHIGVEMLIDAHLIQRKDLYDQYLLALRAGARSDDLFACDGPNHRGRLSALCQHLANRGAEVHEASAQRFEVRLKKTLEHRATLRPSETELTLISKHLGGWSNLPLQE